MIDMVIMGFFERRCKKMEFDGYLKNYNEVFAKVGDKDVALFILSQVAKDRRTAEINKTAGSGNGSSSGVEKATQSQLNYLQKLGIEAKQNLSKVEASKLIDEAKGK